MNSSIKINTNNNTNNNPKQITQKKKLIISASYIAWKVSEYGVLPGPFFPHIRTQEQQNPFTRKYGPEKASYLNTFQTDKFLHKE